MDNLMYHHPGLARSIYSITLSDAVKNLNRFITETPGIPLSDFAN